MRATEQSTCVGLGGGGALKRALLCVLQLALYVLTFLAPRDLLQAAQTCRYWRILAEDNLLWREKCREEGNPESHQAMRRNLFTI